MPARAELRSDGSDEGALITGDDQRDVVILANAAHDIGEERDALARVEGTDGKQEWTVQVQRRPHALRPASARRRPEHRRDSLWDHRDPRGIGPA